MSGYGAGCDECIRCTQCPDIAYCLSEPGTPPCPHDLQLCPDCLDGCSNCRQDMETQLYRSGEYDALADPFYNTHAPKPVDRIARDGGYSWDGRRIEVQR